MRDLSCYVIVRVCDIFITAAMVTPTHTNTSNYTVKAVTLPAVEQLLTNSDLVFGGSTPRTPAHPPSRSIQPACGGVAEQVLNECEKKFALNGFLTLK